MNMAGMSSEEAEFGEVGEGRCPEVVCTLCRDNKR